MLKTFVYPTYAYRKPPELSDATSPRRYPVVIVGAGPVGLTAALDCKVHGIDALVLAWSTCSSTTWRSSRCARASALIDTHRDLSDEQSTMVNAKLVLLLANHIGDIAVLRQAMALAREGV